MTPSPAVQNPASSTCATQPILTITTSKNWVLPPRPKNARKAKADKKKTRPASPRKPAKAPVPVRPEISPAHSANSPIRPASTNVVAGPAVPESLDDLQASIRTVDRENYHLKTRLLSLIHDYKSLRASVLSSVSSGSSSPAPGMFESPTTARKRLYNEIGDPMSELISNMNGLSYKSPSTELVSHEMPSSEATMSANLAIGSDVGVSEVAAPSERDSDVFDFVDLDASTRPLDDEDELESLSLSVSPSASDADENSLMTSLTRSTTVSTNNSFFEKKPSSVFKFYDLPVYSEDDYAFSFEKIDPHGEAMSVIQEDHYNQVADFLEEKLMSNDIKYYVEKNHPAGVAPL
ncbi:hypothetical protein EJF18_50318 [Clavispora lusitaniae]|uniref:Hap4 transcription factor heteromerisation domain-containing protein n=3 Tax=Clavispora lusitaniae TaxID=36911 RepID=C4Y8I2_CLAL4|nr:uncharacterized protein CLUG_04510 [Clavispora lusitaniae ATCC 42720]KAF5209652.1 hypothetical protein E0198_003962 [Clavispora lusitaniae]EEQ40382.1 hypothetical protein CLUG_04510 [Clavispora lusitaniae ATCC 42720]KAF7581679.1 Minimal binding motif of Hap4 for binding to Hap2/3/5 family protein [Clavispora lusitaniae]OVF04882.1 hypothetical protein A9F13_25g00594 [Clavispora lusitaniae]QFZ29090.1 hypothetical protein EJF14_50318 [Clavispora lusitaniae]